MTDAWIAMRTERRWLEADKVVKKLEQLEAKWWADAVQMMERQMHGEVERNAMEIVRSGMKQHWTTTHVAVKEVSEKIRVATERVRMASCDMEERLIEWSETEVELAHARWEAGS